MNHPVDILIETPCNLKHSIDARETSFKITLLSITEFRKTLRINL